MQDVDFFTFLITYNIKKMEIQGKIRPFPLVKKDDLYAQVFGNTFVLFIERDDVIVGKARQSHKYRCHFHACDFIRPYEIAALCQQ